MQGQVGQEGLESMSLARTSESSRTSRARGRPSPSSSSKSQSESILLNFITSPRHPTSERARALNAHDWLPQISLILFVTLHISTRHSPHSHTSSTRLCVPSRYVVFIVDAAASCAGRGLCLCCSATAGAAAVRSQAQRRWRAQSSREGPRPWS